VKLVARAPGKVNLSLLVGGLRGDGRHELLTLIESVSLADELALSEADRDQVVCPGVEEPNIVTRALEGVRARGWSGPRVRIEIDKQIPIAGGMGGGSADAAAALRLARELEPIPERAMTELAAELGSDVPSQLEPGLTLGSGTGDVVERRAPLPNHAFVILPLPYRLSAAEVYAEADRLGLGRSALEDSGEFVNDLQPAAVSLCPAITDALDAVRAAGADHAAVSGSGPTVFGLFWGGDSKARADTAARELETAKSAVPVGADFGHPYFPAQSDGADDQH